MEAESPESRATHLRQTFGDQAPAGFDEAARPNLELKPGEDRSDLDIALQPARAIEGRVIDPWGEPMVEVEVGLRRANGGLIPVQVRTDDRGEYRLFGVPPGRYRVCAAPRYFDPAPDDVGRYVRTCYPSALDDASGGEIVVGSHDLSGVDIRVQRAASYAVSGTVVSLTGRVVESGQVRGRSLHGDRAETSASVIDGQFVLRGLLPGRYVLSATTGTVQRSQSEPPQPAELGVLEVTVAGDAAGVVVPVAPPRTVQGRVRFEGKMPSSTRGMVVQTAIVPRALSMAFSRPPFGAVGQGGAFGLSDVSRVPLTVGVQGLPEGWAVRSVRFDGRDITGRPADLADPSARGGLEIVLTDRVARPLVRVTDGTGPPRKVVYLVILPAEEQRWGSGTPTWIGAADANGTKRLDAMLPGEFLIGAFEFSDLPRVMELEQDELKRLAARLTPVTLKEGSAQVIELKVAIPEGAR